MLDSTVSAQRPFGLRTYARPDDQGELVLRWNKGKGPISKEKITIGQEMIYKWKVIVSRVGFEHAGFSDKDGSRRVLSIVEILEPNEVCSETYVVVDYFDTQAEAENLMMYLKGKFARFLISSAMGSIMVTRGTFKFVPMQDFTKRWPDAELYAKYGLSDEEVSFIENMIKPME